MVKFRVSRLASTSILARNPGFAANASLRRNLKSVLLCGALAMAGLAQAGSLTVTASGASADLSLNGKGIQDGFVFSPTIAADTTNYNLRAAAVSAGWDGTRNLTANITINSGVVVSANNTAIPAFDTGTGFPGGATITLINKGYIIGMGGKGSSPSTNWPGEFSARNGGPALNAQYAMSVVNTGLIGGGGGGGAGGCGNEGGGGGGGQTGRTDSYGGSGFRADYFPAPPPGPDGFPGTFSAPGAGGGYGDSRDGGLGGVWGEPGSRSACLTSFGAGGAAVTGNGHINWTATGTRLGAIN